MTHWKRLWCWERLGAGGEGDDRGWDGWMASPTWWTWVWVNSGSLWWTGRPGVLRFMGSQRVRHYWATELNWTELQSTSCEMLGWMNHNLESRLPGEISITLNMQMTPPYGRKGRRTKELLDESERGKWKSWLQTQHSKNEDHSIQSHHFMANRWGNNGNNDRLFSWAPKSLQMVTAAMKLKDAWSLEDKFWQTYIAY